MFYESERIIRKNEKYEKTKAYSIVSDLKNKGLSNEEMIEATRILLNGNKNESQSAILNKVLSILEASKEIMDDTAIKEIKVDDISGTYPKCPILELHRSR